MTELSILVDDELKTQVVEQRVLPFTLPAVQDPVGENRGRVGAYGR
jgi:hypothetical protein